jgi:mannose-1-phosphate guanylyltransferase
MAGGKGTRLWPISRRSKPKQFQNLVSDKTMLQETYLRMRQKFTIEDIYVSTNDEYVGEVEKELLELPVKNIIGEPDARGSASSVALNAAVIAARHGNKEVIGLFPSDHIVKNPELFIKAISKAEEFLAKHPSYIITIGIAPTHPETGFGYIQNGKAMPSAKSFPIYKTKRFVEKPDLLTAQKYLDSGQFFWNTAMYMFRADAVINKFETFMPDTFNRLKRIQDTVDTPQYRKMLEKEYAQMDKIDFAYGIVENDAKVAVMPLKLGWSDVGSWAALKDNFTENTKDHYVKGEHVDFGSKNLLVYGSKKLITTVGLEDIIIIDSEDVTLICHRRNSTMISDVVKQLEAQGKVTLL